MFALFGLGLLGLALTCYAIQVESKAEANAWCDISDRMSCSRVLKSEYAKMVGMMLKLSPSNPLNVPNTYYGVGYYLLVVLWAAFEPFPQQLMLAASFMSILASLGLAYILYFKLNDFCVVCAATYVVNAGILWIVYQSEN